MTSTLLMLSSGSEKRDALAKMSRHCSARSDEPVWLWNGQCGGDRSVVAAAVSHR